jgi:succinate dehydrogenase / fumarate reductase membrane anchor subunit
MADPVDSLRTPLSRVRYFGSARSGTGHLWAMRVTSAAMFVLTIFFVWLLLNLVGSDYATVRATLGRPIPALVMLAFVGVGAYHMMIGMRVVIEDYVSNAHTREWALIANMLFSAFVGLAGVYAILRISFT